MRSILDSIKPVIENPHFVSIHLEALNRFAQTITENQIKDSSTYQWESAFPNKVDNEQMAALAIVYNSLNFCYWGELKWTVEDNSEYFGGSSGLFHAIKKSLHAGIPLLSPEYLKNLSETDLRIIFTGNIEIPLFKERLIILNKLGQSIQKLYNGKYLPIIIETKGNATNITKKLTVDLPTIFNDVVDYHGRIVQFYKRAQLVSTQLFDLYNRKLFSIPITHFNELTGLADYKVPQLLRKLGILEYNPRLSQIVDNQILIPEGSDQEIEIRACSVWAIELITRIIRKKYAGATAADVDRIIWLQGKTILATDKPCHHTLTIWY